MKNLLLFTLIIFCRTLTVQAQKLEVDSLKRLLSQTRQDTSRVLILAELSDAYSYFKTDSIRPPAVQALQLAQRLKFAKGEGRALASLGSTLRREGNLPRSLETLFKALQINRMVKDRYGEASTLSRIGTIYIDLREYRQALFYYSQSRIFHESALNQQGVISALTLIGGTYLEMNRLDSALLACEQAYRLSQQLPGAYRTKASTLRSLGVIQAQMGNHELAFRYYREALRATYENNDFRSRGIIQHQMAELFDKNHQPDSSLRFARMAMGNFQTASAKPYELSLNHLLAKLYLDQKKPDSAFYYQSLEMALKDSLYGPEKFKQLQLLTLAEQNRQRELVQVQKDYQTRLRMYALSAGLGAVLLLAFVLLRNNRQKQKANALLQHQRDEIQAQGIQLQKSLDELKTTQTQLIQKEKMASLGELTAGIAHEIQNPLNFVNNFSEVSAELVGELVGELDKGDPDEAKAIAGDLSQNLQKITLHGQRASSIVREMLEHSRTSTGEKQSTDLNALADEYLRLAYHGLRAKDKDFNVELKTDFDPELGQVVVASQEVGRVLLNLFNNAFYAVAEKEKHQPDHKPIVSISTKRVESGVEIRVRDNGTGIPEAVKQKIFQPFFTTKPTGQGTGLGLSLAYDIVTKGHGGTLTVESRESLGTEFLITLPHNSQ